MHTDAVLIYHVHKTITKYLDDGKGSLKGITKNIPSSASFGYNRTAPYLKSLFKRISDEIESHHYTLGDFVAYVVHSRLVSKKKSIKLDLICSKEIRALKRSMSVETLNKDKQFLKEMFCDTEYKSVYDLYSNQAVVNEHNSYDGNVMAALVKNGHISPVTYMFFYQKLLTRGSKNIIFMNDNQTVFDREIEVISHFFKGVGYAN